MLRFILKAANSLLNTFVMIVLCTAGMYAGYALWDNNQVYAAAENVQADMIRLKPVVNEDTGEEGASFEELLAVNEDVCGWITVENTHIDFPILQGETNLSYINTDVYGNFALAGSIFLDSRNDREFHNPVSLLYGHYMDHGDMFGDLDLFKEEAFFNENRTGSLLLPDRTYDLEIFSCLLTDASEDAIFEPQAYETDINQLLDFVEQQSIHCDREKVEDLRTRSSEAQILILSTCSSEFTDARTIVVTEMIPRVRGR